MKAIKKIYIIVVVIILLIAFSACSNKTSPQTYGPDRPVSHQLFYDQLSPYGMWVNYPPYGYAWIPDVGWGFSPYLTSGHWVYTRYGWTWHSYYRWGWAPFHYGRWYYDALYGWVWIPDTVWGPGWVVWATGGGYCGWAPLAPTVSVSMVLSGNYYIPRDRWIFVRERDASKRSIERFRVDQSKNSTLLNQSMLVQQTREHGKATYSPGPDKSKIEKAVGKPIPQQSIKEKSIPANPGITKGRNDSYRPDLKQGHGKLHKPVPERVYELKDIRPQTERIRENAVKRNHNNERRIVPFQQPPNRRKESDLMGNSGKGKAMKKRGN